MPARSLPGRWRDLVMKLKVREERRMIHDWDARDRRLLNTLYSLWKLAGVVPRLQFQSSQHLFKTRGIPIVQRKVISRHWCIMRKLYCIFSPMVYKTVWIDFLLFAMRITNNEAMFFALILYGQKRDKKKRREGKTRKTLSIYRRACVFSFCYA